MKRVSDIGKLLLARFTYTPGLLGRLGWFVHQLFRWLFLRIVVFVLLVPPRYTPILWRNEWTEVSQLRAHMGSYQVALEGGMIYSRNSRTFNANDFDIHEVAA